MAGNFICRVKHPRLGEMDVYETKNGARLYGRTEETGQIPFQGREPQKALRALVIAAGYGDLMIKKPTELEKANHLPEKPEKVAQTVTVSVEDDANGDDVPPEVLPEPVTQAPRKKIMGIW